MNQAPLVTGTNLVRETPDSPVAVSIIQQPPLTGSKISMLAYHLKCADPVSKLRLSRNHVVMRKNGLRHLWSTRLCASDDSGTYTAEDQTRQVFDQLIGALEGQGGTLRDDCVRTWIYLKDVDVFYQGMVDSRRELFARQGMNGNSHYIASTGIEGACAHRHDLVAMDAYSVVGLKPQQVSYLNDFTRLNLTREYNVTFERGTRIAYRDRAHYFISGTASIDRNGQVVHKGDVMRQLEHALENVDALLQSGGAKFGDMKYLIVYLRDPTDYARVKHYLDFHLPGLPAFIVEAAVCRPEWLVEVEGVAVAPDEDPALPEF
jgi:enamine deaminase RidA (YjgF/YER057c/UK114 family)